MDATTTPGIFDPAAHQLAALRAVLCAPSPDPDAPPLALRDDELDYLVDALHVIGDNAGYLGSWAQLDAPESSALATIRATVAELLRAFSA